MTADRRFSIRHPSHIELSRAALQRNIRFLERHISKAGSTAKLTSVVKGNAYGHGLGEFVQLSESCGLRSFATFSAGEAAEALRARTAKSDIMIMGAIDDAELDWAVEKGISFYVFDLARLKSAVTTARHVGVPAKIHLEVETGMHRLGIEREDLEEATDLIRRNCRHLVVEGVCTHFAGAETVSNYVRIQQQRQVFDESCAILARAGISARYRHCACSAAALAWPETMMDMVRIGIALYGYWPSQEVRMQLMLERRAEGERRFADPLQRVISWKSRVMAVKTVAAGDFVGYGSTYLANRRTRIAIVPVGYSQGFTRRLSNRGRVLVRGRRVSVIGVVNMNMITLNVTDVPSVAPGDEVVLIGRQKRNAISVASFSEMSQFLNYEMLVRLPQDIPRLVVD